jgi:hypothetical protein
MTPTSRDAPLRANRGTPMPRPTGVSRCCFEARAIALALRPGVPLPGESSSARATTPHDDASVESQERRSWNLALRLGRGVGSDKPIGSEGEHS